MGGNAALFSLPCTREHYSQLANHNNQYHPSLFRRECIIKTKNSLYVIFTEGLVESVTGVCSSSSIGSGKW